MAEPAAAPAAPPSSVPNVRLPRPAMTLPSTAPAMPPMTALVPCLLPSAEQPKMPPMKPPERFEPLSPGWADVTLVPFSRNCAWPGVALASAIMASPVNIWRIMPSPLFPAARADAVQLNRA